MSAAVQQKPEIKIKLSVVKGPHLGQVFQSNKPSFTIGRGPENDIVLMNDPQISRSHAKIVIVDRDLEVVNLSAKNAIIVDGLHEGVQKWKIANNSNFTVGDSEFKVEYDLGQAVVSVPTANVASVLPLIPKIKAGPPSAAVAKTKSPVDIVPANRSVSSSMRQQQMMNPQQNMPPGQVAMPRIAPQNFNGGYRQQAQPAATTDSLLGNPQFKFYLIIAIVLIGFYYNFSKPTKTSRTKKIASTLNYEDEVNNKMISQHEKEAFL